MNLSDIFTERAQAIIQGGLIEPLLWFGTGAGVIYISNILKRRKSQRALIHASLQEPFAIIGETIFSPSGEINPQTGREYFDQKLRNYKVRLELKDIFNPELSEVLVRYILHARKLCTEENPVVFSHLRDVIPAHQFERTLGILKTSWINFFSAMLIDIRDRYAAPAGDRDVVQEIPVFPVLIYEPYASIRQFRILLLSECQLRRNSLPDFKDVRFPVADRFEHDPWHRQAGRLRTHEAIVIQLNKPGHEWLRDTFRIMIPTRQKVFVPPPVAISVP